MFTAGTYAESSEAQAVIRQAIAALQALLDNPPTDWGGDGFDLVHIGGRTWDETGVTPPSSGLFGPDPLTTEAYHAEDWLDLPKVVEQAVDYPQGGPTQAIVIIRRG